MSNVKMSKGDREASLLKFTLATLIVAGCWRPTSWTSLFKQVMYNIYTLLTILTLYTFSMSQLMVLVLDADDVDTFGEALFNVLISLMACYKTIIIRVHHDSIVTLINNLAETPFKPLDSNESMIREKFDKRITNNTFCYLVLILATGSYMLLLSLFMQFKNGLLMYKAWVPFDHTIPVLFYLTYSQQMLSFVFMSLIYPASDSLICGLLLHICCQIEILEYRLSNMMNGRKSLRDCVQHHLRILEYAYVLNEKFSSIVPSEFIMIIVVMSYNLINMTKMSSNAAYIQNMMIVASSLVAIFYYCWFGNEIKLKSLQLSNNIYNMDWLILSNNVKKGLLMIMNRARIPIEFSTANFISMNLESFVMVLKTSYSLFNVMVQSQKQ